MDKVFMPINITNTHYVLIVVFIQLKKIQFFNGLRSYDKFAGKYLKATRKYLEMEANKLEIDFDKEKWEMVEEFVKTPVQTDGNSCAIHACIAADFISDNLPLSYSHEENRTNPCEYMRVKLCNPTNHFEYLRVKFCSDILRGYLDYPFLTSSLNEIDLPTYLLNYRGTDPLPNKQTNKSSSPNKNKNKRKISSSSSR